VTQELREIHATWLKRKWEEQRGATETEEEGGAAAGVPAELETPVAFVPRDLHTATIDIDIPSTIFQGITSHSVMHDVEPSSDSFIDTPAGSIPSPTLSISTVSDLTPTELGEDIGEGSGEKALARHETFYFEDGNVEIVCEGTVFRVHSTIISFSCPKLGEILSIPYVRTPAGPPRISVADSAVDFAVLLKMIHTPGSVSPITCAGPFS